MPCRLVCLGQPTEKMIQDLKYAMVKNVYLKEGIVKFALKTGWFD